MTLHAARDVRRAIADVWILATVGAGVLVLVLFATAGKVAFYLDALERSGLLYAAPAVALASLVVLLAYPRLSVNALGFLLPFNFVGGFWGDSMLVILAKIVVNVVAAGALVTTFLAPAEDRAWITRTRLGRAVLLWLAAVTIGIVIGLLDPPNRGYWLRESSRMAFYGCLLPFGTLLRGRRDIIRLLWSVCAGVFVLQVYAFWVLITGTRYARADAWEGGQSFFRAPYSCASLFILYLAAAALLRYASATRLNGRTSLMLLTTITVLGGGLLASMGRALWLSGALGMLAVLWYLPRDRRTAKAAGLVAASALLAVALVVAFDRMSPASSGKWTSSAMTFLLDLGSTESTSRVTREIEWGHAIDVWKKSPVVGLGFGYPFPVITYGKTPDADIPEPFYIHNSYFNVLAKCGALGFCALLYLVWATFATVRECFRWPSRDLHERILATGLMAAVVQIALVSAIVPFLTSGDTAAYFSMLAGIAVAVRRNAHREANGLPDPHGSAP